MSRSLAIAACVVPAAIAAVWTVLAGKDLNWDLLNYHYYLPYSFLEGRLQQDFFAASAQGYLNPLGFLPFFLLVYGGWHSVVVSVLLAAVHAISVSLLFFIAWRVFKDGAGGSRLVLSVLSTALGAATAVFWPTVGTSFLDPLIAPLVLAALLLLLGAGDGAVRRAALAGGLLGMAASLKYSNAIYAVAGFPLALAAASGSAAGRVRCGLAYAGAGIAAVALFAAPWAILLNREFGSPVFPLMNAWFQSPHAAGANMANARFTPQNLSEVLLFPWRLATLQRDVYSETLAPDVRFLALIAAAVAVPFARGRAAADATRFSAHDWRLFSFFAAAALLWTLTSANGRYGLPVLLLCGVVLARLVQRLLDARAARVVLAVILAVQATISLIAAPPRWFIAEPWSRSWFPYVPDGRALREPALYLTLELLPMAAVVPYMHPASSFVNFRGQHSLPSDSPRLLALLALHEGRVRILGRGLKLVDGRASSDEVVQYDNALRRIGLRVQPDDCFRISWQPDDTDWLSRAANRIARVPPSPEPLSLVSCGLARASRPAADAESERAASVLFDRMEQACPQLFRGQTAVTEPFGRGWSRNYNGLDGRLEAYGGQAFFHRYRSAEVLPLGALSDWQKGAPLPPACVTGRTDPR